MTATKRMESAARFLNRRLELPFDYNRKYAQIDTPYVTFTLENAWYGVEVRYLWVCSELRNCGIGSRFMLTTCEWADRTGTRVWVWAKPFRTRTRSIYALASYYAQFGFEPLRPETRPNFHARVRMRRG